MKKNNPLYLLLFALLLLLANCRKEDIATNLSNIFSVPSGVSETVLVTYYTLDNSGNYLYVFIRDDSYSTTQILKINLLTNSVEKQFGFNPSTSAGITIPAGYDNIVLTANNELIGGFYSFAANKTLLIKFDADLKVMKIDTIAEGGYARTRMIRVAPGKITGLFGNRDNGTGKWFLRYQHMDENMNILSSVMDTSSYYGYASIIVNSFIQTSDGGYLLSALDDGTWDVVLEKRDPDFKLKWRTRYSWGDPRTVNELNGKYYVYCQSDSVFTLIYDLNGNLLDRKTLSLAGTTLSKVYEPMRKTDNGEFLLTARAVYKNKPHSQTGILFRTDADANIITSQAFGGNRMLGACLIKINADKFLLFYLDGNFKPDGASQPRFVMRYVDAKGNFIE